MSIKRLNQLIIGIFIFGVFCFFGGANAASFNCNDATTETELTICANDRLSALDTALNTATATFSKPILMKMQSVHALINVLG